LRSFGVYPIDRLVMSTLDLLLIAWWLVAAVTSIVMFLYMRWIRARDPAAIAWSYSVDRDKLQTLSTALPPPLTLAIAVIVIVALAISVVGLVAFVWMSHWTRLLLLNFQLFALLFGATCLAGELFFAPLVAPVSWTWPQAIWFLRRPLSLTFGVLAILVASYWLIGDLALPRLIVEGRVDRVGSYYSLSRQDVFFILIDGKRYDTTRDVFLLLKAGDQVRAEVGAGSNVILQTEPIH
jgi:hypothetical protein